MRKEEQPLADCGARPGAGATAQGALALCPGERSADQMFLVHASQHSGHRPGAGGVSGSWQDLLLGLILQFPGGSGELHQRAEANVSRARCGWESSGSASLGLYLLRWTQAPALLTLLALLLSPPSSKMAP